MTAPETRYRQAVDALNRGEWQRALAEAEGLLRVAPQHGGVNFVAGVAALQLAQMPLAMNRLQAAIRLSPDRPDYLVQFARGLAMSRMFSEALQAAERAQAIGGLDPLSLDTLGIVYTQASRHAQALAAFRAAATAVPGNPGFRFNLASSLTFAGDIAGAEREYEECLRLAPGHARAHLALAQLRRQTPEANHVERLQRLLAAGKPPAVTAMYLHLALAKELEDLGRYPEAFSHLSAGKRFGGEGRGYTSSRDQALFDAVIAAMPEAPSARPGHHSREPIFVIGMPRSGTTLVERILSSHPAVQSCGELQNFGVAFKRASGSTTRSMFDPDTVGRAGGIDPAALGAAYIASTRPVTGGKPHFVDKLPHNFLYAGWIATALPDAKLVWLRRDPLDTCLGNFRQLFALTSPFYDYSFDLLDTGRYFLMYERLMAHWMALFPGRFLELSYEDLVDDQEGQTRRLLEFCGLDWDPACLDFTGNPEAVATASAVQVREPLNRRSIGRWRRFEAELAPLRELLAEGDVPVPL
ncbi:tetratricopeptide repeat-containing sulfotransferase family protein [Arenimonas composti]|uniref:Uncharacterized protein n=1 Tax=Arenimonas composti TR7-09 = DSM 18010 TaxID=1121013 RepID=A0A091BBZ9_9GAMM|nr:sulfotransferase [Arenimonas composti]KFN49022.1 hypothetical protein P873_12825 [Arenimonas composti TR7-09 = DSM 18010]